MPFTLRPYRRFPVCCPVTYHAGLSEGHGTIWNVSLTGWRLSGGVPLRVGQSFPMTVTLPNRRTIVVAAGIVRWKRGQEYGLETLVIEKQAQNCLEYFIKRLVHIETHAETLREVWLTV